MTGMVRKLSGSRSSLTIAGAGIYVRPGLVCMDSASGIILIKDLKRF
jgi:hypothetical protein